MRTCGAHEGDRPAAAHPATSEAMRLLPLIVLSVLIPTAAGAEPVTFTVDGVARKAFLYAPPVAAPAAGFPVVLAFHGRGDVIENFEYVNLHGAWPEAIVVYFQAL